MNTPRTDAEVRDNFYDDCGEIGAHPEWVVSETTCAKFIALSRQLERELIESQEKVKELRGALGVLLEKYNEVYENSQQDHVDAAYETRAILEKTK